MNKKLYLILKTNLVKKSAEIKMKTIFIIPFLLLISAGCTSIKQTIYLQEIEVNGPVNQPPIHVTTERDAGSINFSTRILINNNRELSGRIEGHSYVNESGVYQVDTVFESGRRSYKPSANNIHTYAGKNMNWNLPDFLLAFDLDFAVGDNTALTGGFNYSSDGQETHIGGLAGIGFFSGKENTAIRLDAGVLWQSMSYTASTVVVTEQEPFTSPGSVAFFMDKSSSTNWKPYISLTFNTKNSAREQLPVNFFLNAGVFWQTLFDFGPSDPDPDYYPGGVQVITNDLRGESTAAFYTLGTGLFFDLNERSKIIVGVRLLKETRIEETTNSLFILPVAQIDFIF